MIRRKEHEQHERRANLLSHGDLPQTSPMPVITRSIDLDADEGHDDAAEPVDEQVAPQERGGTDRAIADSLQRQRDQRDDDQRIEDDGGQDRALPASRAP